MSSNHDPSEDPSTLRDLDVVMLREDLAGQGLARGQTGTIVHAYAAGESFEVEFHRPGEEPVLATLNAGQLAKVWDAATQQHVGKPHATTKRA